jgi:endoglucanase
MNRREFLESSVLGAMGLAAVSASGAPATEQKIVALPLPSPAKLPRWRGFNLTDKTYAESSQPFREQDFEWIAAWGFNFVRLPMSYQCWVDKDDWLKLKEPALKQVDEAVEFGKRHGIHTNLNLHRAPGYCVNPPEEALDLWTNDEALEACAFHWGHLARRYQGISNANVSFDLLNEPKDLPVPDYQRVVKRLVEAIRKEDPQRLIIADGLKWGTKPVPSLQELGIAQSTRGYGPMRLTHYRANWVKGAAKYPVPEWPLKIKEGDVWDKARLRREVIGPWRALQKRGVGVHVGEWGAFTYTPHGVALAWMQDQLDLWKEAGWGWALWNFRGAFGVLDSNRKDSAYEDFHGHKLDRGMLDLLRAG